MAAWAGFGARVEEDKTLVLRMQLEMDDDELD
jgi:hypothetical protein